MSVYGYIRVSTNQQAESGLGLQAQRDKINALRNVDRIFCDEGESGGTALNNRPAGKEMLSILKSGDVVIAAKLDRLFRSVKNAQDVISDFRQKKIGLILLDISSSDLVNDPISECMFNVVCSFAQLEKQRIGQRILEVKQVLRDQHKPLGGLAPIGQKKDENGLMVDDGAERKKIEEARSLRAQGVALRKVAAQVGLTLPTVYRYTRDIKVVAAPIAPVAEQKQENKVVYKDKITKEIMKAIFKLDAQELSLRAIAKKITADYGITISHTMVAKVLA